MMRSRSKLDKVRRLHQSVSSQVSTKLDAIGTWEETSGISGDAEIGESEDNIRVDSCGLARLDLVRRGIDQLNPCLFRISIFAAFR